jgi:hypothetical protein
LPAKIARDEEEFAAHGGTMGKNDNEVWGDFRRNPPGRGRFPRLFVTRRSKTPSIRRSSLLDTGKIGSRRRAP